MIEFSKNLEIDGYILINFTSLSEEEIELVRSWRNNEQIRKWMYNDQEISLKEHKNFIEELKKNKDNIYWLVKKNESFLGVIYLNKIKWNHQNAYLGIYTNPEQKIKGSGEILMNLLLKLAFNILKLHTLKLEVFEDNIVAINLYKKFGFQEEGRLKEFVFRNGKWKDVILMGLINSEYKKRI